MLAQDRHERAPAKAASEFEGEPATEDPLVKHGVVWLESLHQGA
jgi:hypothetical protein